MKYLCATIAFLLVPSALADMALRGGPALIDGGPTGTAKYFALRGETKEFRGIYTAVEGGGWVDRGAGRKSALVGKYQVGVNPGSERGIYGKAFLGIAGISSTDCLLGGKAQFSEDFGVGFRDYDTAFEVAYSHFSSAGLFKPNKGRDFILGSIGVRF